MKLFVAACIGLCSLAACTPPSSSVPNLATSADRPNVVLVIGCTVRADQLSPYGGPINTTPTLSELASRGTLFTHTIAQSSWTRPGTTSVITGQVASSIGMAEPAPGRNDRVLPEEVETIAERFREAGWTTVGVTANPNLNAVFGFSQGFTEYRELTGLMRHGKARKVAGTRAVDQALDALDQYSAVDQATPFYLQILLVDAHLPANVSPQEVAQFERPDVTDRVARYRTILRRFDDAVGRLRDELTKRGATEDNTIFVVTADHGEGLHLPTHHGNGHGRTLYPSTVHVPWILTGPNIPARHRISGLSAQVDVANTLLGLADIPKTLSAEGIDWSDLITSKGPTTDRTSAYTETWFRDTQRAALYDPERMCQRAVDTPLAAAPSFPSACFAWRADPNCVDPIEAEDLMEKLAVRHEHQRRAVKSFDSVPATVDTELEQALEVLGYTSK